MFKIFQHILIEPDNFVVFCPLQPASVAILLYFTTAELVCGWVSEGEGEGERSNERGKYRNQKFLIQNRTVVVGT